MIRKQLFYLILCTGVLYSCENGGLEPEIPEKPPIETPDEPEEPEKPEEKPSTESIINLKNEFMIVGQNWWYSVAYGNGKIVAVGSEHYITTSTDGNNWTTPKKLIDDDNAWYSIAYGNGKFVAVGSGGNIATSIDGVNWSIKNITNYDLTGITYGDGKFVMLKRDKAFVSTDGITWNIYEVNPFNGYDEYNSLCYGGGKFVKVLNYGGYGYVRVSTNGIDWTSEQQVSNFGLYSIAYGGGKFVAVGSKGGIITSTDGQNWFNPKNVGSKTWNAIDYGNGKFVAVGSSGYITISDDGQNWTAPEQLGADSFYDVCAI